LAKRDGYEGGGPDLGALSGAVRLVQTLRDLTGQPSDTIVRQLRAEGVRGRGHVPYELKFWERGLP
jgi:hypothetical protein